MKLEVTTPIWVRPGAMQRSMVVDDQVPTITFDYRIPQEMVTRTVIVEDTGYYPDRTYT